jgi:hypothetical protein
MKKRMRCWAVLAMVGAGTAMLCMIHTIQADPSESVKINGIGDFRADPTVGMGNYVRALMMKGDKNTLQTVLPQNAKAFQGEVGQIPVVKTNVTISNTLAAKVADATSVVRGQPNIFVRVMGVYVGTGTNAGSPRAGGAGSWKADYNRGGIRIALEINNPGTQDDVVVKDMDSATLVIRILNVPVDKQTEPYTISLTATSIADGVTFLKNGVATTTVTMGKSGSQPWMDTATLRLKGGSQTGSTTITATDASVPVNNPALQSDTRVATIVDATKIKLGQIASTSTTSTNNPGYFCTYIPTKWGGAFTPLSTAGTTTNLGDPNSVGWCLFKVTGSTSYRVGNTFVQDNKLVTKPWCAWWYPFDDWVDPNFHDAGSALAKYDAKYHLTGTNSAWAFENQKVGWVRHHDHAMCGGCAGGTCHGATMTGWFETIPTAGKPGGFSTTDLVMLMVKHWDLETATWDFNYGDESIDAVAMDNLFHEQIDANVGPIFAFFANGWNRGLYQYKATYTCDSIADAGITKVQVVAKVTYTPTPRGGGTVVERSAVGTEDIKYKVRFDAAGVATEDLGGWNNKPTHIYRPDPSQPMTVKGGKATTANLEAIYR